MPAQPQPYRFALNAPPPSVEVIPEDAGQFYSRADVDPLLALVPPPRPEIRGHYYEPSPKATPAQILTKLAQVPHFAGVYLRRTWGDVERPDLSLAIQTAKDVVDGCAKLGKGCVLLLEYKHFGQLLPEATGQPAPAGLKWVTHKPEQPAQMAAMFEPAVLARLCWLQSRLADELDGRPGFHALDTSETAPGTALTQEQEDALEPSLRHYYRATVRAFRVARVFANINFLSSKALALGLRDYVAGLGLGLSAADMIVTDANTARPAGMPLLAHMSMRAILPTKDEPQLSIPYAFGLAEQQGAQALTWVDWMTQPGTDWAYVKDFTAKHPLP